MSCHAHALAASRGFLVTADVDLIRSAVAMLPPDRDVLAVDLGAGSGTTGLSVFAERHHGIEVMTVDHDQVALDSTAQAMTNAGYRASWHPVTAKSWDGTAVFTAFYGGRPIDLLLIDAGHEEEDVRRDLAAWLPLVRPGAPLWAHDYTDLYPGVIAAIDAAVADGRLTPLRTDGWGWLGRTAE